MRVFFLLIIFLVSNARGQRKNDNFLENLMLTQPQDFKNIMDNKDSFRVQVIYTKIDRTKSNKPLFTNYTFNVNPDLYFYPASTVKMPVAFLALEKFNELKAAGVNRNSTMITDSAFAGQQKVYTDPTAVDSRPTIENYIKQIFLVSDNNAFNRLYEFLGQEYIQQRLAGKGFQDVAIRHRLQASLTLKQNQVTNPVAFYDTSGKLLYSQPAQFSKAVYSSKKELLGKGYYSNGNLVNQPFDFSEKNKIGLQQLHEIMQAVLFSEDMPAKKRFNLTESDLSFLKHWMSAYPHESKYPYYDTAVYYDAYCKFLLFGGEKSSPRNNIRIFNKPGDAYGFLTDVAYVIDTVNKVEFMLSATILCNSDGIFNDDKYDYEKLGLPFMKNLGTLIYGFELKRKRKNVPNLQPFTINYATE